MAHAPLHKTASEPLPGSSNHIGIISGQPMCGSCTHNQRWSKSPKQRRGAMQQEPCVPIRSDWTHQVWERRWVQPAVSWGVLCKLGAKGQRYVDN